MRPCRLESSRMDKVLCVVLIELPNFPNFFRYRD